MAVKTRRIEARLDPDSEERILQAAALVDEPVSAFMVRAARNEADRILGRADVTLMSAEQFESLLQSLDEPDAAPALSKAASGGRAYTHE